MTNNKTIFSKASTGINYPFMKRTSLFVTTLVGGLLLPTLAHAQTNQGVANLHDVLQKVYDKMSPMCENLLQLSQAIGAIGVTFFIGFRVWKHIARAEAIDFRSEEHTSELQSHSDLVCRLLLE